MVTCFMSLFSSLFHRHLLYQHSFSTAGFIAGFIFSCLTFIFLPISICSLQFTVYSPIQGLLHLYSLSFGSFINHINRLSLLYLHLALHKFLLDLFYCFVLPGLVIVDYNKPWFYHWVTLHLQQVRCSSLKVLPPKNTPQYLSLVHIS